MAGSGIGTTFSWNANAVAEVISMSGFGGSVDTIDTTHLTSTDAFRTFIAGYADGGELSLELNWDPDDADGQKAMYDDHQARTSRTALITFVHANFDISTALTWSATCFITEFNHDVSGDDKVVASVTLKVSAKPTLTVTDA